MYAAQKNLILIMVIFAIAAHELIHTMGLLHAPSVITWGRAVPYDLFYNRPYSCSGNLSMLIRGYENGSLAGNGPDQGTAAYGYGNHFDLMGDRICSLNLNGWYRYKLGWLKDDQVIELRSSRTFKLSYLGESGSSLALIYPESGSYYKDSEPLYALEIRRPEGLDISLSNEGIEQGVLISKIDQGYPFLIEAAADRMSRFAKAAGERSYYKGIGLINNYPLKEGQIYSDSASGVRIRVLKIDADGATVELRL